MGQTKICKAKELVKEVGKEKAIEYFEKQIVVPKDFQDVCNNAGNEVAIRYINEKL